MARALGHHEAKELRVHFRACPPDAGRPAGDSTPTVAARAAALLGDRAAAVIAVSWEDTRGSHEAAKEAIGGPSRLPVRHGGAPTPTNRARATWLRPRQRGWVRGLLSDHGAGFTFLAGYRQRACYQGPKGWSSLVA